MKMPKSVIFAKKKFKIHIWKIKKYCKVRDHCHYTGEYRSAEHSICNLKYSVSKKIPIAFHNGSNYDYHFIIKSIAEEFKKQFTCLEENTEKYISSTVPIEKRSTRIDKNEEEITKNISYILQSIYSAGFMASALSNLVNNLFELIHKIKCKFGQDNQKCETCGITCKVYDCFLEYTNFKDDLIKCKCLSCNKNYQQKFDKKFKKRIHANFLIMVTISFFSFCEKVFILMNIWMIGKNSMKHHYLKKNIFTVT